MKQAVDFVLRRRVSVSVILALVATASVFMQGPLALHNDDMQIYFMLLNGGHAEGALGYGLYTNYVLGWCMAKLSLLLPTLNIYLLYLFALAFVASCCANFYVLDAQAKQATREGRYSRCFVLAACMVLLVVNSLCIRYLQYTHVAIWSAVCGVLLLSSVAEQGRWLLRVLCGALLLVGAYSLRESAMMPALFIGSVLLWRHRRHKKMLMALSCIGGGIALLCAVNTLAYSAAPEWLRARDFLSTRVKIVDTPDNSSMDKTKALAEKGIHQHSYSSFKSFIYTPSMYQAEKVNDALLIHQAGRKGLCGSDWLAAKGFLEVPWHERLPKHDTFFRAIEPWIPLACACLLWLPGAQRRTLITALGMCGALACYLGVLCLFQRMVGRVVDPVLYGVAVGVLALPIKNRPIISKKIVCFVCGCSVFLLALFVKRHWPSFVDSYNGVIYCEAHPDTLYLTTVQNSSLTHRGFTGHSYRRMNQSNILPIADGWSFYSPAYEESLRQRGFQSLETAFLHPQTRIVIHKLNVGMVESLKQLAAAEWGKKVELSVEDSFGELYFVKVEQK